MNELLPCPFCGGGARLVDHNGIHYVDCDNCSIQPGNNNLSSKEVAIAAWNRRAPRVCIGCDSEGGPPGTHIGPQCPMWTEEGNAIAFAFDKERVKAREHNFADLEVRTAAIVTDHQAYKLGYLAGIEAAARVVEERRAIWLGGEPTLRNKDCAEECREVANAIRALATKAPEVKP